MEVGVPNFQERQEHSLRSPLSTICLRRVIFLSLLACLSLFFIFYFFLCCVFQVSCDPLLRGKGIRAKDHAGVQAVRVRLRHPQGAGSKLCL